VVSSEWECFTVENPSHVGIAARSLDPDVILLNAYAPGLNGFEACRRLRRMAHLRHTAIVLIIRESDEVFRTLIGDTGCSLLIATPIGGRRLIQELEAAKETAA
jgi:PleD family two-component response regulator